MRTRRIILIFGASAALISVTSVLMLGFPISWPTKASAQLTLSPFVNTDLNVFRSDGQQLIGHAHYTITADADTFILRGESNYFDGERDLEIERFKQPRDQSTLILMDYEHSFFNPDQSLQRAMGLNVRHGIGSCRTYSEGSLQDRSENLEVPTDVYTGAAQVLYIITRLRLGENHVEFHSFDCIPGPRIIAIEASVESQRAEWSMYPGALARVAMQLDLGWLDFFAAPFNRKFYAWFDPSDNWNFVGGVYDRFYGGERLLTVRAAEPWPQ